MEEDWSSGETGQKPEYIQIRENDIGLEEDVRLSHQQNHTKTIQTQLKTL